MRCLVLWLQFPGHWNKMFAWVGSMVWRCALRPPGFSRCGIQGLECYDDKIGRMRNASAEPKPSRWAPGKQNANMVILQKNCRGTVSANSKRDKEVMIWNSKSVPSPLHTNQSAEWSNESWINHHSHRYCSLLVMSSWMGFQLGNPLQTYLISKNRLRDVFLARH